MVNNKNDLIHPKKNRSSVQDQSCEALHAQTRLAEQALQASKAQKDSQSNVKTKENKK